MFYRAVLFFLFCSFIGEAQERIKVLNADINEYNPRISKARRLYGNVKIQHKDAILYCDTAEYYREEHLAKSFGRVQINQNDTLNLYSDTLFYYGDTRLAQAYGRVKLIDPTIVLKTPVLNYKLDSAIAYYNSGGIIVNHETKDTLKSDICTYYAKRNFVSFKENVYYKNEKYRIETDQMDYNTQSGIVYFTGPTNIYSDSGKIYTESGWYDTKNDLSYFGKGSRIENGSQFIEGDSILYDMNSESGEIIGNMFIQDTAGNFQIEGNYGKFNGETGEYIATENPIYYQYFEEDTLYLIADTLRAIKQDSAQKLWAYHHVKILKGNLSGKCDSLSYIENDSLMWMYHDPILWNEQQQITGDTIQLKFFDGKVNEMNVYPKAFLIEEKPELGYNQIKGKRMQALFRENEIHTIYVYKNAQTAYFILDDDDKALGYNRVDCSKMRVNFEEEQIKSISFLTKPEGTMYPLEQIPEDDKKLKDFDWRVEEKPALEAFLTRKKTVSQEL